jgi:phage major head subunit gpT-like protein
MAANKITERQVIGNFYKALSVATGAPWLDAVSNYFTSDQALEEYAWLGMTPAMREWIGGRNAKGFREEALQIRNKHYEATLEVLVRDLRRDKTGQLMVRINEMARRANSHWASLISDLIEAGPSTTCYDGEYFFDTNHEEGESGSQSNDLLLNISDFPVTTGGTKDNPAVADIQFAIAKAIEAIVGFVDDQGEPMNEDASTFLVMAPTAYMHVITQAVATPVQVAETQSALQALKSNFRIDVAVNPRLTTMGAAYQFPVFRTDSFLKSFIRQEEMGVQLKVKGSGSEFEFDNDAHQYGIDTWRNVGYGMWQNSCLVTME